jgi:hypothetical protein
MSNDPNENVTEEIAQIPEHYQSSPCSTASLIEESGLLDRPEALTTNGVEGVLRDHPDWVEQWMARGGDQRIAGGWVLECEGERYRLKDFSTGKSAFFDDRYRACAQFVVRYVRRIADIMRRYPHATVRNPSARG